MNVPIFKKGKLYNTSVKYSNNKIEKILTATIVIFTVMLVMFGGYSMAKIMDEIVIKANAQIAEPILTIENNPAIDITETQNYGEYSFKVKNYNEQNKLSETDLKYYIEIISAQDKSIKIELYQDDKKIDLLDNKTEYIQISKNKKEEREYKIKITYANDNTEQLNDIVEKIQVKVHTEQEKA
mgnify:CR=1 FL=1